MNPTPRELAAMPPPDVYTALASSPRGLGHDGVANRRTSVGLNVLPSTRHPSLASRFTRQFRDLFAILLVAASVIAGVTYFLDNRNPYDLEVAVAILAIVLLNATIGLLQEYQAERSTEALQRLVPREARVVRGGVESRLPSSEVVPGDVLTIEAGDDVAADARLVRSYELAINSAALTGESAPSRKTSDPVVERNLTQTELPNLVFMGTTVATGSGVAVVFATGLHTEFGRVYRLTAQVADRPSPLQIEVAAMARTVARAALVIGVVMFTAGHFLGLGLVEDFLFALGVMVAVVPEGMPATVTVSLAVAVQQMARRAALIKRLSSVETLGSTNVICTDKTGTLTRGEMAVAELIVEGERWRFSGAGYDPGGRLLSSNGSPCDETPLGVLEALRCASLCTTARLLPPEPGTGWRVLGDPTEGALLTAAAKAGLGNEALAECCPRVKLYPFEAARKRMTSVHHVDGRGIAYMKGAPRELVERCVRVWDQGTERLWGAGEQEEVIPEIDRLAARGFRVLALARRVLPSSAPPETAEAVEQDLCFLGLVALNDPPRPEVAGAVEAAGKAQIRIVMITGDYGLTADAIAHRLGICTEPRTRIITGFDLDHMDDAQVVQELQETREIIFARTNPDHKLRVVAAFQSLGQVVAVTGDGVNDAPALKQADIGVAMGVAGTDVAREAAAMVLLDDSFASIVEAIRLGRGVYDNIRRFVLYLFSHNMGELMPYVFATVGAVHLVPLNALQVLAIDLGSDILPALALGTEEPEEDVMERPPRMRGARLLDRALAGRILFLGSIQATGAIVAFLAVLSGGGWAWGAALPNDDPLYRHAITATQAAIVVSQVFNAFAVRTSCESVFRAGLFRNRRLIAAEAVSIIIMILISYTAPLQSLLNTAPLDARDWGIAVMFGGVLLATEEARKAVTRRWS